MKKKCDAREIFSETANKKITKISNPVETIDDLIRVQEVSDRSHKLHEILEAWKYQRSEERKLRKLYAICFIIILTIQIIVLNVFFVLIGYGNLVLTETQFNVFFISVFGEITAFVLIITRYLFRQETDDNLVKVIKKL